MIKINENQQHFLLTISVDQKYSLKTGLQAIHYVLKFRSGEFDADCCLKVSNRVD